MKVKQLLYRGYLKSCNYACAYCPFCKHKISKQECLKDQEALKRFVTYVEQWDTKKEGLLDVFFTPFGEAMIHSYYQEALAYLSSLKHVRAVGCQTNLSFPIPKFEEVLKVKNGNKEKIRLWCSYHPSMVSEAQFLAQCEALYQRDIPFSVGSVAIIDQLETLSSLRSTLPCDVYMWLNKLDGVRRPYTSEEIASFSQIDPLFALQLKCWKSQLERCQGGDTSLLVEADGTCYSCHISKAPIGNLYEQKIGPKTCKSKRCSCYLAYMNQMDLEEGIWFGKEKVFRMIDRSRIKVFFFDLDGTLLNSKGILEERTKQALEALAKTKQLYVITSRPYEAMRKVCRTIWHLLSGGICGNGAYYDEQTGEGDAMQWLVPVKVEGLATMWQQQWEDLGVKIKVYTAHNQAYKVTFLGAYKVLQRLHEWIEEAYLAKYHVVQEGHTLSVTARECNKGEALRRWLEDKGYTKREVAVVANSTNDISMMQQVEEAIAVPGATEEVKAYAKHVWQVEVLPWIY